MSETTEAIRNKEAARPKPAEAEAPLAKFAGPSTAGAVEVGYKMIKREPPKHINFAEGETVDGIFIRLEVVRMQGKLAARYTVRELTGGRRFTFLGLANIDNQIDRADLGHRISVTCTGIVSPRVQGQSGMKLFEILVSEKKLEDVFVPLPDGPITDDDLPPADEYKGAF
jgi:hypothetical protein